MSADLLSVIKDEVEVVLDGKKSALLEAIEDAIGPNELVARAINAFDMSAEYTADGLHDVVIDHLETSREWVEKDAHEIALDEARAEASAGDLVGFLERFGIDEVLLQETKHLDAVDRMRRAMTTKHFRDAICALATTILEEEAREADRSAATSTPSGSGGYPRIVPAESVVPERLAPQGRPPKGPRVVRDRAR